jgi:hypothetical protein
MVAVSARPALCHLDFDLQDRRQARHGDGHETDQDGHNAKSALDGPLSISVMAPAACVTDRSVRDEGVAIAVAGT